MFVGRLIGGDIAFALRYCSQQAQANNYRLKLSRVGLIFPFVDLVNYVSKSFAKLDKAKNIFLKSSLLEMNAGDSVLTMNTCALGTVIPA